MGSALSAYMTRAGHDVTLLARGEALNAIRSNGIQVKCAVEDDFVAPVRVASADEYRGKPDVIVLCVKSYSLDSIYPTLEKICDTDAIVLPFLNAFRMGDRIRESLRRPVTVAPGVAYIALELAAPGVVKKKTDMFRLVIGPYEGEPSIETLTQIQQDFKLTGGRIDVGEDMTYELIRKFIRVSTLSAAEAMYDADARGVRENPEAWSYYQSLGRELQQLAHALGYELDDQPLHEAWERVRTMRPDYTTSLMHDIRIGRPTEAASQFGDVYELGRSVGLEMPSYGKAAARFA